MNRDERRNAIAALEALRGSRVLAYLTGDRGVASTPISEDVLRLAYEHLRSIGHVPQIDLVLYSRGGDTMLPWPFVNTIRSFCDRFCVLVPFRAHSAATLIAMGADEIVMTPLAQLTPVEPTITMPFNPPDTANPGRQLGINVEDIKAYLDFARDRGGIDDSAGRAHVFGLLAQHVHPVSLGNLHRFHQLANMQAKKLLELHMDPQEEAVRIDEITDNLVSKLWAHEYKIVRTEARWLGLKAVDAPDDVEATLWDLFTRYEVAMDLQKPILPATAFPPGQARVALTDLALAYLESSTRTDVYQFDIELNRPLAPTPPGQPPQFGPQVQITVTRQEWVEE
jgi:hypothetical protein